MKNSSKKSELLKIIRECVEASTSHGIPSVLRNDNIVLKIMWTICFLISFAYCIYGLTNSFKSYFAYEVNTQMSFERVSEIEFPTITICNKHPFNIKESTHPMLKAGMEVLKNKSLNVDGFFLNQTKSMDIINEVSYFLLSGIEYFNLSKLIRSGGYSMEEMLINCRFNDDETCTAADFEYVNVPAFINCYKFNSGKNSNKTTEDIRKLSSSGRNYGLRLELFTGFRSIENDVSIVNGAHVFITNSTSKYFSENEGFSVSNGFSTEVVIKQVYNEKLPQPYSNCVDQVTDPKAFDSFLYNLTVYENQIYEQKSCLTFCIQKYIIDKCNCYFVKIPNYRRDLMYCLRKGCGDSAYKEFFDSRSKECFDECPPECNSIEYNLQMSQIDFPSLFYSDLLIKYDNRTGNTRNYSTHEQVKSSTLALNIYYNDIGYTKISESPAKNLEQFIGEIGGFLGLCIGISLLSVVEIFEIIFKIFHFYLITSSKIEIEKISIKSDS